jgi:hypothetical protein
MNSLFSFSAFVYFPSLPQPPPFVPLSISCNVCNKHQLIPAWFFRFFAVRWPLSLQVVTSDVINSVVAERGETMWISSLLLNEQLPYWTFPFLF